MNFDDYQTRYEAAYAEFAATVRLVLEKAISGTDGIPRPQSIQCRAKAASHLKPKLEVRGLLGSQTIEQEIRDLAGARLIFYTNTDVDRFLQSRLISENFEVHWGVTRVHHPTEENARQRYRAIHYTVSLNPQRIALPEYAMFKGMRCEIQIQTILSHAWAETAHDILYKPHAAAGFGGEAMKSIHRRMTRIMDDYLVPAGYEFQKVQHDFERLMQGKALFDRGAIDALAACGNNNERHEILSTVKDYVLPNYDDIAGIYPELQRALLKAFDDSRATPTQAIETPFGNLAGTTPQAITSIVTDILSRFRYVDVEGTFRALLHLHRGEQDTRQRDHISRAIKDLAEYNLHIWQKVGPGVQMVLIESIDSLSPAERLEFRYDLFPIWQEVLSSELRGTSLGAESVTLRSGSLIVCDEVKRIRQSAINGIFDILDRVVSEHDKTLAINAARSATQLPSQANYSSELVSLVLSDTLLLAQLLTQRAKGMPYQLLAYVENYLLFDYQRAHDLAEAEPDRFACRDLAESVMRATRSFHEAVNEDIRFVRYKTLVGYASVFQPQWDEGKLDYRSRDEYRQTQIAEYVAAITPENEGEWFELIELCAATKSNDLGTFPIFAEFILALAKDKPVLAERLLERAGADLLTFLPAFLGGIFQSGVEEIYERVIADQLAKSTHLAGLARHWRLSRPERPAFIDAVLDNAITAADDPAVIECIALTTASHGTQTQPPLDTFFSRAMRYLVAKADYRWVREVWYLPQAEAFFAGLATEPAQMVLNSLLAAPKIGYETEKILSCIAATHAALVWNFLAQRIAAGPEHDHDASFDAIPYEFRDLKTPLSSDAALAIDTVRRLYRKDDHLFEFGGARLLSEVFPTCPEPFVLRLSQLIAEGSDEDIDFAVKVLRSYRGTSTIHGLARQLVLRLAEDDPRLPQVEICLDTTGMVSGQFGFVEAYRTKKAEIVPWLEDESSKVRGFAARFIARLDTRIAAEQRSAEERMELRKREYDTDDTEA